MRILATLLDESFKTICIPYRFQFSRWPIAEIRAWPTIGPPVTPSTRAFLVVDAVGSERGSWLFTGYINPC